MSAAIRWYSLFEPISIAFFVCFLFYAAQKLENGSYFLFAIENVIVYLVLSGTINITIANLNSTSWKMLCFHLVKCALLASSIPPLVHSEWTVVRVQTSTTYYLGNKFVCGAKSMALILTKYK